MKKRIAIFLILVFALLAGVVSAESFDTQGKISEDGITYNTKESFSLSGNYKTKVLVNINKYELERVGKVSAFTEYGKTKITEVEYDLITFQENEDISIGYVGEVGKYVVPSMTFSVELAPTADIEEVKLKSTKTQNINLTLPKFIPVRVGEESYTAAGAGKVEGYYPGEYYKIIERSEPTGAKTIVFILYPLQYDNTSQSGILYYNYEFEIISKDSALKNAYIFFLASLPVISTLFYLILREKRKKEGVKK